VPIYLSIHVSIYSSPFPSLSGLLSIFVSFPLPHSHPLLTPPIFLAFFYVHVKRLSLFDFVFEHTSNSTPQVHAYANIYTSARTELKACIHAHGPNLSTHTCACTQLAVEMLSRITTGVLLGHTTPAWFAVPVTAFSGGQIKANTRVCNVRIRMNVCI
jgi:hypothetical protein